MAAALIEIGVATMGALASGAGYIRALFPDNNDGKEIIYRSYEDGQPNNGFRLILVTQEKTYNKAVRVYRNPNSGDYFEVKAGDSTGMKCNCDFSLKFDVVRVDFPQFDQGKDYFTLNLMKSKVLGFFFDVQELRIYRDRLSDYNSRTLVIYWPHDGDEYFKNEKNLIKPYAMFSA